MCLGLRRIALCERDELIAQVDEPHSGLALVDADLAEHRTPERERPPEVIHFERHMIDPDQPRSIGRHTT